MDGDSIIRPGDSDHCSTPVAGHEGGLAASHERFSRCFEWIHRTIAAAEGSLAVGDTG